MDTIYSDNEASQAAVPTKTPQLEFESLVTRHRAIITRVTYTYCWHPDDRAELQQEILTQLWRAFPKFDEARRFSTWMYRVALNVAISYVRSHSLRSKHMVQLDESVHDMADETSRLNHEADARILILQQFSNSLDALNRALLLLYLEQYSHQEISDVLGISVTNVATKISRMKKSLRALDDASRDDHSGEANVGKKVKAKDSRTNLKTSDEGVDHGA